MTNNKGITLIALVITIIVLLILAGVSIAMLTGQNGILTRATDSKIESSDAEIVERVNMELNAQLTNAMTGNAFDTQTTMEANIGTVDGYTITAVPSSTSGYDTDNKVTITITSQPADSGISKKVGTVSYDTENGWTVSGVEANS